MSETKSTASIVRALRNIAWNDERIKNDETGKIAHAALVQFAKANAKEVRNDIEFGELKEYMAENKIEF